MHVPIEGLAFLAYLDSLFVEGSARQVAPLREPPDTLNRLHAQAMREHARERALLAWADGAWSAMPDWRLDRQIIRLALYLSERLDVEAGQRIAIVSELRPEWLVADLAALGLGAVSVAIDPRAEADELAAALSDAAPSVTFMSTAARERLESLDGRAPAYGQPVAIDAVAAREGTVPLQAMLELGGTLDTPERAQAYRAAARALPAERPAIRHYRRSPKGGCDRIDLTQGQVIERITAIWRADPAHPGDVAYVSDPAASLTARLALYACLGDGYTTTALGPAEGDAGHLAELRPARVVAPARLLATAARDAGRSADVERAHAERKPRRGWLGRAARRAPPLESGSGLRETLGNRVRWIASTDPLDTALAARLAAVAALAPQLS
ncbi:MAG TPA: AMP-binding protein [Gemmatimonadales bacterium]|nr:AMP-binding protein [Gemmatimonadales bacterium]